MRYDEHQIIYQVEHYTKAAECIKSAKPVWTARLVKLVLLFNSEEEIIDIMISLLISTNKFNMLLKTACDSETQLVK